MIIHFKFFLYLHSIINTHSKLIPSVYLQLGYPLQPQKIPLLPFLILSSLPQYGHDLFSDISWRSLFSLVSLIWYSHRRYIFIPLWLVHFKVIRVVHPFRCYQWVQCNACKLIPQHGSLHRETSRSARPLPRWRVGPPLLTDESGCLQRVRWTRGPSSRALALRSAVFLSRNCRCCLLTDRRQ